MKRFAAGDTIISNLRSTAQIEKYADDGGVPGLLQPGYVPPVGGKA